MLLPHGLDPRPDLVLQVRVILHGGLGRHHVSLVLRIEEFQTQLVDFALLEHRFVLSFVQQIFQKF